MLNAFSQIDSENIRKALRELTARAETDRDCVVRDDGLKLSKLGHEELMRRGDTFSVPYFMSDALARERIWFSISIRDVEQFPSAPVADEVNERLASSPTDPDHLARLLSLLGRFASAENARLAETFLRWHGPTDLVRSVAYET